MTKKIEQTLVIGDIHFPYQDKRAIKLILNWIKEYRPNKIILNGDIIDFDQFARFPTPVKRLVELPKDIKTAQSFFAAIRRYVPTAEIIYLVGNHERRFEASLITENKALQAMGVLDNLFTVEQILDLKKYNITYWNKTKYGKESYFEYKDFLIGHFLNVRKDGAYTAKALADRFCKNIIQGHVHRGGAHFRKIWNKNVHTYEGFCLCDMSPKYILKPNWQQGFMVLTSEVGKNKVFVRPIFINNYEFEFDSKIYRG